MWYPNTVCTPDKRDTLASYHTITMTRDWCDILIHSLHSCLFIYVTIHTFSDGYLHENKLQAQKIQ